MTTPLDPQANGVFWNQVNQIAQQPAGLTAPKPAYTYPKPININIPIPGMANAPGQNYFNGPGAANGSSGGSLQQLMNAIRGQESSGNYGAVNHDSGALGAYQMLPGNEAAWSQEVFGKAVPVNEFLANRAIQDRVAQYELGKYLNQYGLAGAAAAWYGGPGMVSHMYDKTPYGNYPSMYDYVQSILNRYGAG